ncbi:hypothetical protein J7E62_25495 [Variovorax paradoxus]|nr:hypothetical protein [Variovorax paradoxus]
MKWLGPHGGVNVDELLTAEEPFKKRAKKLRPLVREMWGHSNSAAREAFEHWFERFEHVRALRSPQPAARSP